MKKYILISILMLFSTLCFTQVSQLSPEGRKYWIRATTLLKIANKDEDYLKVASEFENVLQHDKNVADVYYNLGIVYSQYAKRTDNPESYKNAKDNYTKYLSFNPKDSSAIIDELTKLDLLTEVAKDKLERKNWTKMDLGDGIISNGERNSTGLLNGKGETIWPDGAKYVGEYKKNYRNGKGIYAYPDGGKYEGQWKNGVREGRGTLKWKNGAVYDGEWKADKIEGYGKLIYANGDEYEGLWKNGLREDKGTMKLKNGAVYDGEWKADKHEGYGKLIYANGDEYEGLWKNGLREDKGTLRWKVGAVYDGEWKADKREGYGKMVYSDKTMYEGYWKNGVREGKGTLCDAKGIVIYKGKYKDDKPDR